MRYPEKLHIPHNSAPLAPEQIELTENDLSPYSLECLSRLAKTKKHRSQKLTATFRDRVKYVCHGLNLKLYLELGMELVEVHRGVTFHQEPFIKPYIDMCANKRAAAKTKSDNMVMKLLSNSLYGKMIEGVSQRMDCKFNYNETRAVQNFSDPLYKGFVICGNDFSVSFHRKKVLRMRQSWAVGFSILELSKYTMQHLLYNVVKPRFGGRASVLMSDTDSWVLVAPRATPDQIVQELSDVMDFSNYDPAHPLYDGSRKSMVGYLKNEVSGDTVTRFAGIRSKTYAFMTAKNVMDSRAKGVKKCYKQKIPFEDFTRCLTEFYTKTVRQVYIASKNHCNMLVQAEKVAFSSFDDKRYLLCPVHSVPYGSKLIADFESTSKCLFCQNPTLLV